MLSITRSIPTMELELTNTYSWFLALTVIVWGTVIFSKRERLPNAEFLRISSKPGKAGDASDVQAFLDDSLSAIMKGYKEV